MRSDKNINDKFVQAVADFYRINGSLKETAAVFSISTSKVKNVLRRPGTLSMIRLAI